MPALTNDYIWVGNGSNVATAVAVTGNVTISNTGVTMIGAAVVTNAMLAGSIAASKLIGTDIATVGTITSGVWNGTVIGATYGGTGVNNGSNTITLGGSVSTAGAFTTSGAYSLTLTTTAATNVTLPTSGTLVNTGVTTLSSLASIGTITTGTWNGTLDRGPVWRHGCCEYRQDDHSGRQPDDGGCGVAAIHRARRPLVRFSGGNNLGAGEKHDRNKLFVEHRNVEQSRLGAGESDKRGDGEFFGQQLEQRHRGPAPAPDWSGNGTWTTPTPTFSGLTSRGFSARHLDRRRSCATRRRSA